VTQFTTNAQNILRLNPSTHGHVWSRTVAPFQRSRDGWEWFDGHRKFFCEAFLHYQLDLITPEFLSIPTDKNPKDWGGVKLGALARKLRVCGHILVWRTHSCRLFKYFRYTLCKPSVRPSQTTQSVPLNLITDVSVCVVKSQKYIIKVTHTQQKFLCSFYRQHVSALFWAIIRLFIRTLIQKVKTVLGWRSPFYIKIHY
jgi:hypothetical protein